MDFTCILPLNGKSGNKSFANPFWFDRGQFRPSKYGHFNMPSASSRIIIDAPRQQPGFVHWEGKLVAPFGETRRIYFEFSTPDDRPYPVRARPFLLAFLVPAMQLGAPLELELPVDTVTVNNLMEWQEAIASWNPQSLKVVPIHAPASISMEDSGRPGALTAFSGGVDSNFTVWRNTRHSNPPEHHTSPLQAGLMVHGFDIPLEQQAVFESARGRSRTMLEAAGLKTYRLGTNLRSLEKLPGHDWEKISHGIWIAAALSCYEPWFGQFLIPSTYPYQVMRFPWGSNPVTDPLFSSAAATYWHDGAAYSKLTKMQAIANIPAIRQHLRVCWEGEQLDRNCGKCFKCIATQICFQLSGVERPEAFPRPYTIEQAANLPVKNSSNEWLLRSMSSEAERQGKHEIARALDQSLALAKVERPFRKIKRWLIRHHAK
jgi:hypothetical protein